MSFNNHYKAAKVLPTSEMISSFMGRTLNTEVFERLKEKNLTPNAEKCKFHMTQMVFMGLVLSNNGIDPAEDKLKAIVDARTAECITSQKLSGTGKLQCPFHHGLCYSREAIAKVDQKGCSFRVWKRAEARAQ